MEQLTRWAAGIISSASRKIETQYAKIAEPLQGQRSLAPNHNQINDPLDSGVDHFHRSTTAPQLRRVKRRSWGLSSLYHSTINSLSAMSPDMINPVRLPILEHSILSEDDSSMLSGETLKASPEAWILDFDAASHMTSCQSSFLSLRLFDSVPYPPKDHIKTDDDAEWTAAGIGTVALTLTNNNKILLSNVYFVPGLRRSKLSLHQIQCQGLSAKLLENEVEIRSGDEKIASALWTNNADTLLATEPAQGNSAYCRDYYGFFVRYVRPVRDHRRQVTSSRLCKGIIYNYDASAGRYKLWDMLEKRIVLTATVILLDNQLRKFDWQSQMDTAWGTML